jgi:hypothetical protein
MSQPSQASQPSLSRRTLLAGAGTAGALAAAATLLPGTPAEPPVAAAQPALEGGEDGRYRATAHVMRYYQTAKV